MKAKPLLVMLFCIFFIALFASGAIGGTDLTPDTPPVPTAEMFDAFLARSGAGGVTAGQPCGSSYTVRTGDTLSRIAQVCNLPLPNLLAANPTIGDPHLIREGQVINVYYPAAAPAAAAPVVDAAAPAGDPASMDTFAWPTPQSAESAAEPAVVLPVFLAETGHSGLRPGSTLHVSLVDLPPASLVRCGIGRVGDPPQMLDEYVTDEQGGLSLQLAIPQDAQPGESWVVTITTTQWPEIQVTSVPFEIEN